MCGEAVLSASDACVGWRAQFISKTSNFLIPIIGWSMYLTGHVPLKRMDRRSQMVWRLRVGFFV